MEAAISQRVKYPSWVGCRKLERKPHGSLRYSQRIKEEKRFRGLALAHLQPDRRNDRRGSVSSEFSCSDNNSSGCYLSILDALRVFKFMKENLIGSLTLFVALLQAGSVHPFDEDLILKASVIYSHIDLFVVFLFRL